jgi:sporulation integral membrane protein YlbJ
MTHGLFGALAFLCFILMILFPQSLLNGAQSGLALWAHVLMPSLLPFFIISEMLIRTNWLTRFGRLLSPLMRPLFHLPGDAGFVLLMGYTTGFPMGAVLTRRLYETGRLTRSEAAVLVAFTNNASPLFILAAIASSMMGQPALGFWIALCHYGANLLYGFCLARFSFSQGLFFAPIESFGAPESAAPPKDFNPGLMITESIRAGVQNIIQLGGYIVFFSVIIQLLDHTQILPALAAVLDPALPAALSGQGIPQVLLSGLLEMTAGLSRITSDHLPAQTHMPLILGLLGFSGLSVQAQVAGMISGSGIPLGPYLLGRFFQPLLSIMLFRLFLPLIPVVQPVIQWEEPFFQNISWQSSLWFALGAFIFFSWIALLAGKR